MDSGLHVFTAPANTTLNASTTYWISVNDGTGANRVNYDSTSSDEQAGETGWTIGDSSVWRSSETSDWNTQNASLVVEVKGNANAAASTDATLSALTVSPKNIIGFDDDRTSYEVGVASTVSQATIAATANHSGATVAITPADADDVTDGHQVALTAGRNAVTVEVTAEDTTTTKTYTVSVNQGVTDGFGWNSDKDFDGLIAADITAPRGMWSDGTTMWIVDNGQEKIFAYTLATGAQDSTKDFDTLQAAGNESPIGIWSDGTTMWVGDHGDKKIYAYNLATKARDSTKDFDTLDDAGNDRPRGIWSDGTTMWVANEIPNKLFAYKMSDKERDTDKEFNNNIDIYPNGIWSDGTTMWVVNTDDDKVQAYRMSDKQRDTSRDFETLGDAGNDFPKGLWGDQTTMWVSENHDDKVYAYNMPPASTDATLSGISVAGNDIAGFEPDDTSYTIGVASTVSEATVTATPNDAYATVVYSGTDADTGTDGHQVALTAGEYTDVTITVTAEDDSTTEEYTLTIYRGSTADFAWRVDDDEERLIPSGNLTGAGVWADTNDLYVVDNSENRVFVYNRADRSADYRYFDLDADNSGSSGITSDGTTFWVSDSLDHHLYAYAYGNGDRQAVNDIDHDALGVTDIMGIWERDGTIWGVRPTGTVVAIDSSEKTLVPDLDFSVALALEPGEEATSAWHDGVTAWVSVPTSSGTVLRAINVADGSRNTALDFTTLAAAGVSNVAGIWSDGDVMWVVDNVKEKVYSFNVPESTNADLRNLTVSPKNIIGFDADRTSYEVGVASTVAQATLTATTAQASASVAYSGTDASTDAGHQVALSAGKNTVTATVTAQDGNTTKAYTININQGITDEYGWKASDDLDGFAAADLFGQIGIAGNGATFWITTENDSGLYAFNNLGYAESTRNITPHSDNGNPAYLWANATDIYVVDDTDNKAYVYRLSDGARQNSSEFNFHADNADPAGIWSDGATVWIVDTADTKLYAYTLSGGARDGDKDIDLNSDNGDPTGIASNGATIWVADATDDKLYAYELESGNRIVTKEINALTGAGNTDPTGMWVTSTTLLVNDSMDSKAYSYNVPPGTPLQEMDDATLSALTVAPKNIIGFDTGQDYYEVGFASTVTQATVTATATNSAATVVIKPTDADTATGHQVDLSAGRNTVTITVTSQDSSETEVYTLSLNRGVEATYGWKASEDFDGLIAAELENPEGMWSNGTTMWVGDSGNTELVAFSVADKTRQTTNDVNLHADNHDPRGIWSDQTTIWVADDGDDKIFAYQLSDGARDSAKDFDTLNAAGNNAPRGIWSDGTTMWVLDQVDEKIYAYRMSDKQRDQDKEFEDLATANTIPEGIWSDGVIMWVAQRGTSAKLFAYRMSDKQHDESRDFNTLEAIGSQHPIGITSDGVTMWVAHATSVEIGGLFFSRAKVFSFNMPPVSTDATLGGITVGSKEIVGFTPERTSYQIGVASTDNRVTVTPTPTYPDYPTFEYSEADADDTTPGHQVDLSTGRNALTITVTAQDTTTTKDYTLSINRGTASTYGWKAVDDFDGLNPAGNNWPTGIWSDGSTTWVADGTDGKIYAYNADGTRDPSQDFNTLQTAGNTTPFGIWSNGTTMWVGDASKKKIYAYNMSDRQRDSEKDFNTPDGAGNDHIRGIWSDGTTMWVSDQLDNRIYAYNMADKQRIRTKEINLSLPQFRSPDGIWSDGVTMWVAIHFDDRLRAYSLSERTRKSSRDFSTPAASGNQDPVALWSDGTTMWATDSIDDKVYSYNMPLSDDKRLISLTVSPRDIIGFQSSRTAYEVGVGSTIAQATVRATKAHAQATVAYSGTDTSPDTPGHQVDLSPGKNTVTVTVTAQDESTKDYTVNINRGVTDPFGWNAEHDFDGLVAAGNQAPTGMWSNETTIWVADSTDDKIYAYRLSDMSRDPDQDFNNLASGNDVATGIWSDGATMWVTDFSDQKIYAYRMSDKQHDSSKEFTSLPGITAAATDLWSDGVTMWVAASGSTQVYAYNMSDKQRNTGEEFTSLATENTRPLALWSDGSTMWFADVERKIYAYRRSDQAHVSTLDFNTLSAAGINNTGSIWSDGAVMWVSDLHNDKIYAFNMPLAPPASFQAQSGDTRVTLSWDNPQNSGITGYQYRVSNDGGSTWDPDWTPIPNSNHRTTSFTVRNLPNGVEHVIEVRALESVLQSAGVRATVTPLGPPGLPLEPTNLKVYSLDQQLRFIWEPPSAEDLRVPTTSYDVQHRRYGRSDRWQNATRSNTDLSTVQLITGLTNRVAYEVQVAAVNRIGRGPWAAYSGVPQGHQSPPATGGDAGLDLGPLGVHWTDGNNPHALHPDTADLNRNVIQNQCLSTETFTVFWPVLERTPEEYQAHFITHDGAGEVTHQYRTERVPTGENQEREQRYIRGAVTVHRDTRVTVRVRARFDPEGWSTWSHPAALYCYEGPPASQNQFQLATAAVAPPDNLQAQAGDTTVTLTWNQAQSDTVTGYEYRVSVDTGGTWSPDWTLVPGSTAGTTSFTVEGLTNGFLYTFDVRSLERQLQSEQARAVATPRGAATTPPEAPGDLDLSDSSEALRARWKHPAEDPRAPITSYDVRYRIYGSSDPWTDVTRTDTDRSNRQTISGLTNRVAYEVQVAAVNRIGRGPWATDSGVPQPDQPHPDEADNANADLRLTNVAAWWTTSDHGSGHPDTTSVNVIENQCLDTESFIVRWDDLSRQPEEFEAHFITYSGAGEVTHEYRTENGQARIYGSVPLHRDSNVRIQVRARFDPEGWTTWSKPAGFYCFVPEPEDNEQEPAQQNEPANTPATGKPTIAGTAEQGETLTAATDSIADVNGINNAVFTYQWSRYNGTTTTAIEGAGSATYTVHEDDVGNQVSVTVSFADDDGFQESVTSDSVLVSPPSPLYGGFDADTVPQDHNGQDPFTFQIHFSEEPSLGYAAVRDHVLTVTGGTVTGASRTTPGENIRWTITLQPEGDAAATVELPATASCSDDGARLHRLRQDALQCHQHHRGRTRNPPAAAGEQPGHRPADSKRHGPGGPDPHRRRLRRLRWRRP